MRRGLTTLAMAAGLGLGLAACEGGGDPVEQALRDASAARQAAATRTTAELEATRPKAPAGDEAYVASAIEEHQAAIARAEASLRRTSDPELRRLGQATIDSRKAEIAALQAWRPAAPSEP